MILQPKMAVYVHDGCTVGRSSTNISKMCETSCQLFQSRQQVSETGGNFRSKLWCLKPQRTSLQWSAQRRKFCSIISVTAMASRPIRPDPPSLSDYILDSCSGFLLSKVKEYMGSNSSTRTVDPLDWLPPKLHEQLHKSEAFAIALVREGLVFGTLGLMYYQINNLCNGLYRIVSATSTVPPLKTGTDYKHSVFHAATAPLRLLISIWASTRLLRIVAASAEIQHYVGGSIFWKTRRIGIVVSGTWFLYRWKENSVDKLISKNKIDKPRIIAFDRLISLVLYFLAATSIAEIVGFALRSLLAVGGISGLAVGLAAKEVVSNFLGAAVILFTRPFVIGERIKAGAISGQVQDIGYLQTKILGFDGVPLLVPNQAFTNQVITNFSRATSKLLEASFYLHNQDVFLVNKITEKVVEYLTTHPQVETQRATPMCYLKDMGHWGPEIAIMCTINYGGGSFFAVRQEIMVQVARIIVDVLGKRRRFSATVLPICCGSFECISFMQAKVSNLRQDRVDGREQRIEEMWKGGKLKPTELPQNSGCDVIVHSW